MAYGKNLNALILDGIEDAINTAPFTIKKLAYSLPTKGRFRGERATVRELGKAIHSFGETIKPF
jgi:hypothetical protein